MATRYEDTLTDSEKLAFRFKLANVEQYLTLGASLETAAYAAMCNETERNEIYSRVNMVELSKYLRAKAEVEALRLHSRAREVAASKGNAAPAQWYLERLNKNAWGTQITVNNDAPIYLQISDEDAKVV